VCFNAINLAGEQAAVSHPVLRDVCRVGGEVGGDFGVFPPGEKEAIKVPIKRSGSDSSNETSWLQRRVAALEEQVEILIQRRPDDDSLRNGPKLQGR